MTSSSVGAPGGTDTGTVTPPVFRSGYACLVGRPNAGKSTLTNALVGQKVAITSDRPQTTRHTIRGILHRPDGQLVLVDTPGLHRPRTLLGQRLNDLVTGTLSEVDVVGLCLPAPDRIGPGDRWIATQLAGLPPDVPKVAVVTKTDLAAPDRIVEQLVGAEQLATDLGFAWAEIVPVSAVSGEQVSLLADLLLAQVPEGPALYPDGELTDAPEELAIAELVREAALDGIRDELPHSVAVVVEEVLPREGRSADDPLLDVRCSLFVERDSQKGIIIGRGGARLVAIGTRSRAGIEALLGTRVHLDIHVKVAKDWQRDPRQLNKLGF